MLYHVKRTLDLKRYALIVLLIAMCSSESAAQAVFEVNSTMATGTGTLHQAITDANASVGVDTVKFNITGDLPHVIQPTGPLPEITDAIYIDGFSQPGTSPNTNSITDPSNAVLGIALDGVNAGMQNGLEISAGSSTIRGLAIYNFQIGGIYLNSPGGNHISGCYVGVSPDGATARPNANHGVGVVEGIDDIIGGPLPEHRNVISGNTWVGIAVINQGTQGTVIQGNFIGLDADGTKDLGNGQHGINAGMAASGTAASGFKIGGDNKEERNVISGNTWSGILVLGNGADNFQISGNYIGTDRTGTIAIPNELAGLGISSGPTGGLIGGFGEYSGNLISGNVQNGMYCQFGCDDMTIQGNIVGTDPSGSLALGNGIDGITVVDSDNALVGGPTLAHGNIVADNERIGIYLFGSESGTHVIENNTVGTGLDRSTALGNRLSGIRVEWVGHTVRRNHVANNTEGIVVFGSGHRLTENQVRNNDGIGIDLGGDGRTANDPGDADGGVNFGQNFPELSDVSYSAGSNEISVTYSVPSNPASSGYPITVEFFVADAEEGSVFVGSDTYTSTQYNSGPNKTITFNPQAGVSAASRLVATATTADNQSSEFSNVTTSLPIDESEVAGLAFEIRDIYPNPVDNYSTIVVRVSEAKRVDVEVIDILGRTKLVVFEGVLSIGEHEIGFDTSALTSGLYFLRLKQDGQVDTARMMVAR